MKVKRLVAGVVAIVITLWLLNYFLSPALAHVRPGGVDDGVGILGDSFGGVTALFSGFGAFSVVIILAMGYESERTRDRPFVAMKILSAAVESAAQGDHPTLEIDLRFEFLNVTEIPALNLRALLEPGPQWSTDAQRAGPPLFSGTPVVSTLSLKASGDSARTLLRVLRDEAKLRLSVRADYESLNGTVWESSVHLELELLGGDSGIFREITDNVETSNVAQGVIASTGASIIMKASEIEATWKHREKRPLRPKRWWRRSQG